MKLETEFIAQAIHPQTKTVHFQSSAKSEAELLEWFKKHASSGKFAGLECHIQKRRLINGRPLRIEQRHILWALIGVQFLYIVWSLSQ